MERLFTRGLRLFRNLAFAVARNDKAFIVQSSKGLSLPQVGSNVGIIITTFEQRFQVYALPLISSLRKSVSYPIYLVVNGNYEGPASAEATQTLILRLAGFKNVFPIFFGSLQGCASLWNTGIKHSNLSANFVFNDDISVNENTIAQELELAIDQLSNASLITINHSWSHFLISRDCINSVGDFDERFLGFGEEDGDYIERIYQQTGAKPSNILLTGFVNLIDHSREESIAGGVGKYSLFNKCLIHLKYPHLNTLEAPLEGAKIPQELDMESIRKFKDSLYPMLISKDAEEVSNSILRFYS